MARCPKLPLPLPVPDIWDGDDAVQHGGDLDLRWWLLQALQDHEVKMKAHTEQQRATICAAMEHALDSMEARLTKACLSTTGQVAGDDFQKDTFATSERSRGDSKDSCATTEHSNHAKMIQEPQRQISPSASAGSAVLPESQHTEIVSCAKRIDDMLQYNLIWAWIVLLLTFWALFINDLKTLFLPAAMDTFISFTNWIVLGIFALEFMLCCVVQSGYGNSLQSLMDLFAVLSLIPFDELAADAGIAGGGTSDTSVARVARAARALRILRATRATAMAIKARQKLTAIKKRRQKSEISILEGTLTQRTNIKMLLGVLVILVGTSFMDHQETDRTAKSGLQLLDTAFRGNLGSSVTEGLNQTWQNMIIAYANEVETEGTLREILKLEIAGEVLIDLDTSGFRNNEIRLFRLNEETYVEVSLKALMDLQACFSVAVTLFVVFVMLLWTGSFARDYRGLVLEPVDRMIAMLREMSHDPRMAISRSQIDGAGTSVTEMREIEVCMGKFAQLMKVGFGEAGMEVIAKNLGEGSFDPLVPGVIVHAIFGFCDIRNFTDCCEVLNEDTMIFTNKIAAIVHECVEQTGGSVNKNIGDAFLSVWKLRVADGRRRSFVHHLNAANDTVDESVRSFIKMHAALKEDASIQRFCEDERLQKKIPGYTVKMGYGLHLGWAVEGAVGSRYKVDATYLSPHVNMASRLEAATKQYGVNILMSNALVDQLGADLRKECRPIDIVTVKGSMQPVSLYVHQPTETPQLNEVQIAEFMESWDKGFALYRNGTDWPLAAKFIEDCMRIVPGDGPSQVILEVMRDHGGTAPQGWQGFHALTSK